MQAHEAVTSVNIASTALSPSVTGVHDLCSAQWKEMHITVCDVLPQPLFHHE